MAPFDENLARLIRLNSLFSPETQAPTAPQQLANSFVPTNDPQLRNNPYVMTAAPVQQAEDDAYIQSRMQQLYQPETRATDRFFEMINQMPQRNKPGLGRKILGGLAAFAGPDYVEQALYGPYHRELSDYMKRIEPVKDAASIERQNNANARAFANQILSGEMSERRLDRQIDRDKVLREQGEARLKQGDERIDQGDKRLAQADARIAIAREVALGGQFEVDDAGNAKIIRKDGTTIPVDAQYLTFEEKEALKARTALSTARARADASRDRYRVQEIEDPENPGRKISVRINLDTNEAEPIPLVKPKPKSPAKVLSPNVSKAERPESSSSAALGTSRSVVNRAQQVKNSNPKWSKWIKIDGSTVTITRPGLISGPSAAEYNQMYNEIYKSSNNNDRQSTAPKADPLGIRR